MMISAHGIATAINTSGITTINANMISDGMSEPSSPESTTFDESDLLNTSVHDDVTAQLAASGTIGIAAAAAIASGRKRKRPHSFETNPSVRKRQQTRLLRKLRATIDEYTTRVGQQAIVLCCTPGKTQQAHAFRVFGSQPLESVIRNRRAEVLGDLEATLSHQLQPANPDASLHELPPLVIDGIPTPVDKMTQAQLRAFIPEMLKYSTARSKPGWGKPECRPIWWPDDVPWANVRSDVRSEDQKKKVSWTHALRTIVRNCYKHHGRDDLMPKFLEDNAVQQQQHQHHQHGLQTASFHPTMVQTINNPDGTVSVIQIDTGESGTPQVITLADGTQAQVVHTVSGKDVVNNYVESPSSMKLGGKYMNMLLQQISNGMPQTEANQAVQTLAEVASNQHEMTSVGIEMADGSHANVAHLAEASLNSEGQIILTGDPNTLGGMVTIPVSMYQAVVTSLPQLQEVHHGGMVISPQVIAPHHDDGLVHDSMEDPDEDVKPHILVTQNALVHAHHQQQHHHQSNQNGDVPDATHAVEVMTVEQS